MSKLKLSILLTLVLLVTVPGSVALANDATTASIGTAVIWDDQAASDAITYSLTEVDTPATGTEYVGWLVSDDGSIKLSTGVMTVNADGSVNHVFDHNNARNTGENLIHAYDKVVITVETAGADPDAPAGPAAYSHVITGGAITHIRHLLTNWPPGADKGILTNLKEQLDVAIVHANLAKNSTTLDDVLTHTHHVINAIEGASGANYDISFTDPGDGIGVLTHASDRSHAGFAAGSAPNDASVVAFEPLVSATGKNAADWATVARDLAVDKILPETSIALAKVWLGPGAGTIISSLEAARSGFDTDNDGAIESIAGEGGAAQAYVEAQRMATYTLGVGGPAAAVVVAGPSVGLPAAGDSSIPALAQIGLVAALVLLSSGAVFVFRGRRSRTEA